MSQPSLPDGDTPEIQTAREILHDTAYFKASKEYQRYWVSFFTRERDEAMQAIMTTEPTHEAFLVHKALYLQACKCLGRLDADEAINLKMIEERNKKFPK